MQNILAYWDCDRSYARYGTGHSTERVQSTIERACHLLLVIGDRKTQEDLNRIPINEGVPF